MEILRYELRMVFEKKPSLILAAAPNRQATRWSILPGSLLI